MSDVREKAMDAGMEVERQEECTSCGWHGRALAVVEGTFVHWACPRCHASHTGLLPGKTVRARGNETPVAPAGGK